MSRIRAGFLRRLRLAIIFAWILPGVLTNACYAAVPPVRIWGELGYDYRLRDFAGDEHIGLVRLNALTYVVEPWIGLVQAGVGFGIRDGDFDDNRSSGQFVNGDLNLRLFPQSQFPFEAFISMADTTTDSEITDLDTRLLRYGVEQRYNSPKFGIFRFRFEHRDREESAIKTTALDIPVISDTKSDLVLFEYEKTIGQANKFFLTSELFKVDVDDAREGTDSWTTSLLHRYRSAQPVSAETRLTYIDESLDRQRGGINRDTAELTSLLQWRPRTQRPVHVIGTARIRNTATKNAGSESSSLGSAFTAGATYQWSNRWSFQANSGVSHSESDRRDTTTIFFGLGADYVSAIRKIGDYDYTWSSRQRGNVELGEERDIGTVLLDLGHGLNRTWLRPSNVSLQFSGRQSIATIFDSKGRSTQQLQHSVSGAWTQRRGAMAQSLRLSFDDARAFGGGGLVGDESAEYQSAYLQGTLDYRFSRVAALRGNITLQATRTARPSVSNPAADVRSWRPVSTVNLTYDHSRVFNVPRLSFRSRLEHVSDAYLLFVDDPQDLNPRRNTFWENRLEYRIGRLRILLIGQYSRARLDDTSAVLLQVRRYFGNY